MNYGHLILITSTIEGALVAGMITAATGGNYVWGEVGMVALGGAIVGALIPFILLSMFDFEEEMKK
jgi:hypothetical protein